MTRTGSWRPLRLCVSALFVSALVRAESPGTHYPSGGTRPGVSPQASAGTNAPYARTITIYGSVNTNDLLRFLDRTGSRVGGTNVLSALDYYGTNWQATAAAEAAARAAGDTVARTNLQAALNAEAQARAAGDLVASTNLQAALDAEALARAAGDAVGLTNWQAVVYSMTNGAALGATALQPAATNGWVVGSHAGLATWQGATNAASAVLGTVAAAYRVDDTGTNSWTVLANGTQQVYVVTYSQVVGVDTASVRVAYADIRMEEPLEYSPAVGDIWPLGAGGYIREGWILITGAPNQWLVRDEHGYASSIEAAPTNTMFESGAGWDISFEFPVATNSVPVTNAYPLARSAEIATHNTNGLAHADIRDAIDAIPLPPTNAVAGWLVYDSGSNCYWRVSATNLRFYVWGVEP